MRMLWPDARHDVDPVALYAADARPSPADRPWVLLNMIATADGAASDPSGRSGGLAGPADRRVFGAIRAIADVIVAGASTVRTERYGPARPSSEVQAARAARGQTARPRIAVVSGSLALDPSLRLFRQAPAAARPIVVTTARAAATPAGRDLAAVADLMVAGDSTVDWRAALDLLATRTGAKVVLVEGGPTTSGQLADADLVDELCLTISPHLASGDGPRVLRGVHPGRLQQLTLARVLTADDFLFLRYVRAPDQA